jgi:hypothetical protein
MPVACYWEAADTGHGAGYPADVPVPDGPDQANGTSLDGLATRLREFSGELPHTVQARLRAISACLAAAGLGAGAPVTLAEVRDTDWVQVRAGAATVACTVARIDGVPRPVVIALATWPAPARGALSRPARSTEHGAQATANGSAP